MSSPEPETPRSGGLLPSQGIEWSLIWLAVGILGMVFVFFSVLGSRSNEQPKYDNDSQIAPRPLRDPPREEERPEVGAETNTEPA